MNATTAPVLGKVRNGPSSLMYTRCPKLEAGGDDVVEGGRSLIGAVEGDPQHPVVVAVGDEERRDIGCIAYWTPVVMK